MRVLLTGAAGFIGFHLSRAMSAAGFETLGVDNLNSYYDPQLKQARLQQLEGLRGFRFRELDLLDEAGLARVGEEFRPTLVVHLAAQAGVRYSLDNPGAYADSNVRGHLNMLELARRLPDLRHFVYASSSSVYGDRGDGPFRETDRCDTPASVYAATKRAGELLTTTYCRLYGLRASGLRFFTVYGPWGRPDMAYWTFTDAILRGKPIRLYNGGQMRRDFTDIRDICDGVLRILKGDPPAGNEVYNIGHSEPVELTRFVAAIERATGVKAIVELAPMQPGDVGDTFADVTKLADRYGYHPRIAIEDGIPVFVDWYRRHAGV